jgi:hypothetical protein
MPSLLRNEFCEALGKAEHLDRLDGPEDGGREVDALLRCFLIALLAAHCLLAH